MSPNSYLQCFPCTGTWRAGGSILAQIPLSMFASSSAPSSTNAQSSLPRWAQMRDSGAGGGMRARFAGLLNGITKASVNRRRGRSNREFQSQVCIRCRQVGPLAGGDICDVQAVVNVQLGDKAGNGQVATMDLGRCSCRAHLN